MVWFNSGFFGPMEQTFKHYPESIQISSILDVPWCMTDKFIELAAQLTPMLWGLCEFLVRINV